MYVEIDPTGRYGRLEELLGKGAMKKVYRAFDEVTGMEVAWNQAKLCDVMQSPENLQRMHSEIHLLATLRHSSIIRFHTSWVDPISRSFNFITELFTSGTLRQYRQRYRNVDMRAVKSWARQILEGLVYLHGHEPPVIHRDLKCDNVFVNGHLGQVKIGDLGLAAILVASRSAHSVIGTPEFMAPELYEEEYNELVDLYSFGMCVLEMVTSEYPYSECSNPAQIYKKVTSGKLPDAFFRVQDPEARRFIGRCLEKASNRSSAKELLVDPFMLIDEHLDRRTVPPALMMTTGSGAPRAAAAAALTSTSAATDLSPRAGGSRRRTDMTITGKMNLEDDTIFLKVQITDPDGTPRNIYFPFDVLEDTPMEVAKEMVKELEIAGIDPLEIAEVIDQEVSTLAPNWKKGEEKEEKEEEEEEEDSPHVYNYNDDTCHPFYCMSTPSSSHSSFFTPIQSSNQLCHESWLQEEDDERKSTHSFKYSAVNYSSGSELDVDPVIVDPPSLTSQKKNGSRSTSSRFCHKEGGLAGCRGNGSFEIPVEERKQRGYRVGKKAAEMTRNNGLMVDMRSQLLHKTLVEEVNKRLFKTVGAVENIGFRMPWSRNGTATAAAPPPLPGISKNKGHTWGQS